MSYKKNSFYLMILSLGSLISSGLGFAAHILIARNVTPEVLGNYSAIFFLTSTLAPLAGFGMSQYLLKVFGEHGWAGLIWVKPILQFVKLSTLLTWFVLIILACMLQDTYFLLAAAAIMSITIVGSVSAELIGSIFQLEEEYALQTLWQLSQSSLKLILLATAAYVISIQINEIVIAIIFACAALAIVPIAYVKTRQLRAGTIKLKGHSDNAIKKAIKRKVSPVDILKESWPYGVSGFFHLVYFQLNIVLINFFLGAETSGNFSVGFTLITAAAILPGVIYQKFLLPKMHRWCHHDRFLLYKIYNIGNYVMGSVGLFIAILIYFTTPYLIEYVFGPKYQKSITIINYLIIVIPIFYIASSAGSTLITGDHMRRKVKYMGVTAIFSILATSCLIPYLGVHAGAASLIMSFTLLTILFIRANRKYVFKELLTTN